MAVSYTHLDVYKRQAPDWSKQNYSAVTHLWVGYICLIDLNSDILLVFDQLCQENRIPVTTCQPDEVLE